MLQALDAVTGLAVTAEEARREGRYLCPECGRVVGPRLGARKLPHFAHFARTLCAMAKPESERHQALKRLCRQFFAPLPVTWEVPLGERRVDGVVGGLFVVECQASPLAPHEWQARTANHNRQGFPVLWLWDIKRLCRKNTLEEAFALERSGRPVWVGPELRLCHEESRDVLFVADKHRVIACRLARLSAREEAVAARIHGFLGPNALRKLVFLPSFDKNARFHFASKTKGLRLVRFANVAER